MALDVKELCRLCGKKDEFSKDLKDEDNKNILKMIQEFIRIPFAEHDELPTKVCLNCEEKIESFQLFIVECYNVQETLRQMCLETCEKHLIKLEDDIVIDYNITTIKSEVDELSAEDLVNAINSDECMTGYDADDYNNDNNDNDMSNVTLATLKDLKQEKTSEKKIMKLTDTGKKHFKEISDLNTGDFVDCDKCLRIIKTISAMNKHKMTHMPKSKGKFCCSSCDKEFTSQYTLRSHMQIHMPIEERKMYSCDLCLKRYKTHENLKKHMNTHKVACPVCSRVLKNRLSLRQHLIVHDDERRYVCPHCDKTYKRRPTLKEHINTHTGDKPVTCKWCDERFTYSSQLSTHRMRCHPDKMAEALRTTRVSGPEGYLRNDAVPPLESV